MGDETFDLVRAVSFNSRRRTSKMEDLLEDNASLRGLLKDAWGIIMDIENYDPVPGYRVDDFLSGYELAMKEG